MGKPKLKLVPVLEVAPIRPGADLIDQPYCVFKPAIELGEWVKETIIDPEGKLFNPDHEHLVEATIGWLWTNQENSKKGRRVVGQAEEPVFRCGKWQKARQELQLLQWFGDMPDFIITLDAEYCHRCSDSELLALIEHELYHCAQSRDAFDMPKFNQDTGLPMYTMRGHDVEEFVGVVKRYGVGDPEGQLAQLVKAANCSPEISNDRIATVCGTCK